MMLEIAKKRQMWAKIFGDRVLTIKMVPPFDKNESMENTIRRGPHQDIVHKAAAGILSTGYVIIGGMRNINKKYTFRREDGEGNWKSTIERSPRQLMEEMKFNDYQIWINVCELQDGVVVAFFETLYQELRRIAYHG